MYDYTLENKVRVNSGKIVSNRNIENNCKDEVSLVWNKVYKCNFRETVETSI